MRKSAFAVAAAIGMVLGVSAPASAVTFGGTVTPSSTVDTGPKCDPEYASGGTGICFSHIQTLNFDLSTINEMEGPLDLFKVKITDEPNHPDDKQSADIKVLFEFTLPSYADGTITGDVTGHYETTWNGGTKNPSVSIVWDDPIKLDFGDSILEVQLLDLVIDCKGECVTVKKETYYKHGFLWFLGDLFKHGYEKKKTYLDYGYVQGKFTLIETPSSTVPEVPLPATLPLFAAGIAGFAYFGFRRRPGT